MVPLNEVLIAKIVLGYLSSRKLSGTADCFVKECEGFHTSTESGICEKERILNHLEGLNLLPSLEDILNDYFAYQGPDEVDNDKVYMLWKQLDVVIGQLRAITMGKTKTKAFMNSRRGPRTYTKLVSKHENSTNQVEDVFSNVNTATKLQSKTFENPTSDSLVKEVESSQVLVLATPSKRQNRNDVVKREFKSPRRKTRHPRHIRTTTEVVSSSAVDSGNDTQVNKEFSDLVSKLITNDKLTGRLADNINKVVSVETKPPNKDDEIDEIIKLTADDPDLNVLFSMLSGSNANVPSIQDGAENNSRCFEINAAMDTLNFELVSSSNAQLPLPVTGVSNEHISDAVAQPTLTSLESSQVLTFSVANNLNLQNLVQNTVTGIKSLPHQGMAHVEPFLLQNTNFLDMLNSSDSSDPLCMGDLNGDFINSYQAISTKSSVTGLVSGSDNSALLTQPVTCNRNKSSLVKESDMKKNVDDNVILASHALLQLSTSPLKLSTISSVENVISKAIVSPQALASNRKETRELICSTSCAIQKNSGELTDGVRKVSTKKNISIPNISPSTQILDIDTGCNVKTTASTFTGAPALKKNLKSGKKKGIKKKSVSENTIVQGEEEETSYKKQKRAKEIMVAQLDFNPTFPPDTCSTQNFNLGRPLCNSPDNGIDVGNCVKISPLKLCDQNKLPSKTNIEVNMNSANIESFNTTNLHSQMPQEYCNRSPNTKLPTTDQFQTFRIKGNAISKVLSSPEKAQKKSNSYNPISDAPFSCKSKIRAISMVINNTNSLNKISESNSTPPTEFMEDMSANCGNNSSMNNKIACFSQSSFNESAIEHSSGTTCDNIYSMKGLSCFNSGSEYHGLEMNQVKKETIIKNSEEVFVSNETAQIEPTFVEEYPMQKEFESLVSKCHKSPKKKEKTYPIRSRSQNSKKMKIKFDFKKSPTRKKYFDTKREDSESNVKSSDDNETRPVKNLSSTDESLISPLEGEVECQKENLGCFALPDNELVESTDSDQKIQPLQSILDDFNGNMTSQNRTSNDEHSVSNYLSTIDLSALCPDQHDKIPLSSSVITSSVTTTVLASTSDGDIRPNITVPPDLAHFTSVTTNFASTATSKEHVTIPFVEKANLSTSVPLDNILTSPNKISHSLKVKSLSPGKIGKRKAKRKKSLSLLMNVDDVAQLLTGIDYS